MAWKDDAPWHLDDQIMVEDAPEEDDEWEFAWTPQPEAQPQQGPVPAELPAEELPQKRERGERGGKNRPSKKRWHAHLATGVKVPRLAGPAPQPHPPEPGALQPMPERQICSCFPKDPQACHIECGMVALPGT